MAERADRREFLTKALKAGAAGAGACLLSESLRGVLGVSPAGGLWAADPLEELIRRAPLARFWVPAAEAACASCHDQADLKSGVKPRHAGRPVKCLLCAHGCVIADGGRGRCRARMNVRGELRSLVYGRPLAEHVDPIEKKPFYHFLPGVQAYSLATAGCPLRCRFCQNWELSQASPEHHVVPFCPPGAMAARAGDRKAPVLAFTYNEPTVFTEYLTDVAREGRKRGLRSVIVSCGFMAEAPLTEMLEVLDAVKIDLKGFSRDFYREVSGADLEPVLRSIKQAGRSGRHLEIVNLVVPTLNDSPAMMGELVRWVAGELGPDVPVHFTRFHPDYQLLNLPPTPVASLERAREMAMKVGIRYAYVGNVPGHPGNNTYCPGCGKAVIERSSFFVTAIRMKGGACASCGHAIAGVWS